MSELTAFRDHAKRLSASRHRDNCDRIHRITKVLGGWARGYDLTRSCDEIDEHEPHDWIDSLGFDWFCPGLCGGCMPDDERALWVRLADEVDAYLAPQPDLFGGVSDEFPGDVLGPRGTG